MRGVSILTNFEQRIIVVGYAPNIAGGMTQVTKVLLKNFENMELHPYKICYYPKIKALYCYVLSIIKFVIKIVAGSRKCNTIVLLQIGSANDSIRAVPYIWLSKLMNLKICTQYHTSTDKLFNDLSSGLLSLITKSALQLVDIHCFLSRCLETRFTELYPYKTNSRIIPNSLDEKWILQQVLPKEARNRDIVFLGRWCWEKGVDDLIECMAKVKANVTCEFYTDHVPTIHYKNCQMFPWANEAEVLSIIQTAKLVVLPSYTEAYPTVLLEAAACGTPFLASNVGGIPDIVEESGGGRVFEAGNISKMVEIIDELLNDDDKWHEMSRNGKAWVKTLSEKNIKKLWLDVFGPLNTKRDNNSN